jgi:hypothetical protein
MARSGHLKSAIHCAAHSLTYTFDGQLVSGATPGDLVALEMRRTGRLILVRAGSAPRAELDAAADEDVWQAFAALAPRTVVDLEVAADWKVIVEQWLESPERQQRFVAPNQLVDVRDDGALILQALPKAPGRSRIRRFDFIASSGARGAPRPRRREPWQRRADAWLREQVSRAESTQAGLAAAAEETPETGPVAPAVVEFRALIAALLQALPEQP